MNKFEFHKPSNLDEVRSLKQYGADLFRDVPNEYIEAEYTEIGNTILTKRILVKDAKGNPTEDVNGMLARIVGTVAAPWRDKYGKPLGETVTLITAFRNLIASKDFSPNSPTYTGAGTDLGQLSACFVLPVDDTFGSIWPQGHPQFKADDAGKVGIFDAVKHAALVHQTGGGTGFSFSRLRAAGSQVGATGGVASGPISFMIPFNAQTEAVKQGRTRRGANMGILRVDARDVYNPANPEDPNTFVNVKLDLSKMTNFNISVGLTGEYVQAVFMGLEVAKALGLNPADAAGKVGDSDLYTIYDHKGNPEQDTDGHTVQYHALEVLHRMARNSWVSGEPGWVRLDMMNYLNPNGNGVIPANGLIHSFEGIKEPVEATNPCGEQPLPANDSCNLGSINLGNFVLDEFTGMARLDTDRLFKRAFLAALFLNLVIDANRYPLPQIEAKSRGSRRIGLGVMGSAEMLAALMLDYESEAGRQVAGEAMETIELGALACSMWLAEQFGTYAEYPGSMWEKWGLPTFNGTLTTVAPTGTISMLAARPGRPVSGGVEPKYGLVMTRNQAGELMIDVDGQFEAVAKANGFYSEALMRVISWTGSCQGIQAGIYEVPTKDWAGPFSGQEPTLEQVEVGAGVPDVFQAIFKTAHDINPRNHVLMQVRFQYGNKSYDEYTSNAGPLANDSATSKTINFTSDRTVEDIFDSMVMALALGLKGFTGYRDGSRGGQVLNVGQGKAHDQQEAPKQAEAVDKWAELGLTEDMAKFAGFDCKGGSCSI